MTAKDLLDRKSFCVLLNTLIDAKDGDEQERALQRLLDYAIGQEIEQEPNLPRIRGAFNTQESAFEVGPSRRFGKFTTPTEYVEPVEAPKPKRRGRPPKAEKAVKSKPAKVLTNADREKLREMARNDDKEQIKAKHIVDKVDKDQKEQLPIEAFLAEVAKTYIKPEFVNGKRAFFIPQSHNGRTVSTSNSKWEIALRMAGIGFNRLHWIYDSGMGGDTPQWPDGYFPLTIQ